MSRIFPYNKKDGAPELYFHSPESRPKTLLCIYIVFIKVNDNEIVVIFFFYCPGENFLNFLIGHFAAGIYNHIKDDIGVGRTRDNAKVMNVGYTGKLRENTVCKLCHTGYNRVVDSDWVHMSCQQNVQLFGNFIFDIINHIVNFHKVAAASTSI